MWLEFSHVWFCFFGGVILFGVVDCELSISRAKGIALIDDPGNLLKGIDKKTIRREGIESIKRVFICGCKVASISRPSNLKARGGFFRFSMKGKFYIYLL